VRVLELHRCTYVVRESVLSHRGVRVVRELELRRCTYAVHVSALRRCTYAVHVLELRHDASDLALHHHGEHVVHELELHLYMNVVGDL
jgi:hypothetical protein